MGILQDMRVYKKNNTIMMRKIEQNKGLSPLMPYIIQERNSNNNSQHKK